MNVKKMKEKAYNKKQDAMIDYYVDQCEIYDWEPDEDGFNNCCAGWKYENFAGHIDTPEFFS